MGHILQCFDEYFYGKFTVLYCEQKFKKPNKFCLKVPNPILVTLMETQSKRKHIIHGYTKQVNSNEMSNI